jgi:RimJ/RimL family protein N-acetyltransferase
MTLTTQRLLLRLFTPDDVDDMYAYERLESVNRYLYRPPRDRARCAEFIGKISQGTPWETEGDGLTVAVCRLDAPGVIGQVNIQLRSVPARQTEIGWTFHPDHGGRGYATEAARALAVHAFDALATHRLYSRLDAENTASVRVCERLGMRREAHLIENDCYAGRWGSEYVYAALSHDLKR